ncbi:hypothetical protein L596_013860 [Steinernema carpocapsae]|uniref:Uncharacterized protein n=1 Tax=Steinernema carpocapsae TaxID=34508 RepID=A0A4U5P1F0_STECR|nr:hypothetical protein L596_013860 [Steinernema carpocapsae]
MQTQSYSVSKVDHLVLSFLMRVFLLLLGCLCPFLVIGAFIAIGMVAKPHTVRLSRDSKCLSTILNVTF